MKKRLLSGILSLCMLLSLFVSSGVIIAGAEQPSGQLSISQTAAAPGEEVTLDVSIQGNPGIMALILGITYDTTRLSFTGYEDAGYTDWTVAEKAVWMGNSDNSFNGVILKLKFKVLENAAAGLASVAVTCGEGDAANSLEQPISFSSTAGGITVAGAAHTHTPGQPVTENAVPATCAQEGSYDTVVYCTGCGEELSRTTVTVPKADHQYEDGVCKVCGAREPGQGGEENPRLIVSVEHAAPGEEATVSISTENNPGIMALVLGIQYDVNVLSLEGFEDAGFTDWTVAEKAVWIGNSDNSFDGVILKLKFRVLDTVPEGLAAVTVVCGDGDASTSQEEPISFTVVSGGVVVSAGGSGPDVPPVVLPSPEGISMRREYLLLTPGLGETLEVENIDERWLPELEWASDNESVATVDGGAVTAVGKGTAFITASVEAEGRTYAARCRIDVTDSITQEATIDGVSLCASKVTVELFRTDYARIPFVFNLQQNYPLSTGENESGDMNTGAAVESAKFVDAATAELFDLVVRDDRTLEICPKDKYVHGDEATVKSIKSSYKSAIELIIDGQKYYTSAKSPLTISVKKTLPNIKVKIAALNLNYAPSQQLVFTGSNVIDVTLNPNVPQGKTQPGWVELNKMDDGWWLTQTGTADKNRTVYLLVTAEGYAAPKAVTVNVSSTDTAPRQAQPKLVMKPASVTVKAGTADTAQVMLTATPANYEEALPSVSIVRVEEGTAKYASEAEWGKLLNCSIELEGENSEKAYLTIKPASQLDGSTAHTFKVYLGFMGKEFPVTVRTLKDTADVTITAKTAGTIDTGIPGSGCTTTVTAKGFNALSGDAFYYVDRVTGYDANTRAETDCTDYFQIAENGNLFSFKESVSGSLPTGCTYFAYIRLAENAVQNEDDPFVRAKLNVKWTDPSKVQRSVTLKLTGQIDVIRPGSSVIITPTIKNCYTYALDKKDLIFYQGTGKARTEIGTGKDNPCFDVEVTEGGYVVTLKEDVGINHKTAKFAVGMKISADGSTFETKSPAALKIVMGKCKFEQSDKTVQLLKRDCFSSGIIKVSTTDQTLSDIDSTKLTLDKKSSQYFELREIGYGTYAIHFKGNQVTTTKGQTVKISVFLEGNETASPNATISVKVAVK